jgi:hypothetical protein
MRHVFYVTYFSFAGIHSSFYLKICLWMEDLSKEELHCKTKFSKYILISVPLIK